MKAVHIALLGLLGASPVLSGCAGERWFGGNEAAAPVAARGLGDFDDNTVSAIDRSSTPGSGGAYAGPEYRGADAPNVVGDSNPIRRDATGSAGVGFDVENSDKVRELQRALMASGFDPGPIDGIFGPQTRSALMQYQRRNNLGATGWPDRDTIAALGWPQLRDYDDNTVSAIDMSSTPGSGGVYAGPSRRSPVAVGQP